MYIGFAENLLIKTAQSLVQDTVRLSHCTYHPPLMNNRCHFNALWHLQNTKEVVKVHAGFVVSGGTKPELVAHFICEDIYEDCFDPTLPNLYGDFYVIETFESYYNAYTELIDLKDKIKKTLPYLVRPLVKI